MANKGDWLDLGGASASHFGAAPVEVRISGGDERWKWERLRADQIRALLALANEHPDRRDAIMSMQPST